MSILRRSLPLALPLALFSCALEPADPPIGTHSSAIVGGKLDPDDAGVLLVIIDHPPSMASWIGCTGVVVSPHVVLTAAHCITENTIAEGYRFRLFLGDNLNDAAQENDPANYHSVIEAHANPDFTLATVSTKGNDVGVLITSTPLALTPFPLQREPLGPSSVGAPVRIVGYGAPAPGMIATVQRMTADTVISSVEANLFNFQGSPNTCEGDSGGPSFIKTGGADYVAGIHSGGSNTNCMGVAFETRVDAYTSFIDPFIEMHDPGFLPPPMDAGTDSGDVDSGADSGSDALEPDAGSPDAHDASTDAAGGCALTTAPKPSVSWSWLALGLAVGAAIRMRKRRMRSRC